MPKRIDYVCIICPLCKFADGGFYLVFEVAYSVYE